MLDFVHWVYDAWVPSRDGDEKGSIYNETAKKGTRLRGKGDSR